MGAAFLRGQDRGLSFLGQHLPDFCKRINLPRNWDRRQAIWGPPYAPKVAGGRVLACVPLPNPDPTGPRAHLCRWFSPGICVQLSFIGCVYHTHPTSLRSIAYFYLLPRRGRGLRMGLAFTCSQRDLGTAWFGRLRFPPGTWLPANQSQCRGPCLVWSTGCFLGRKSCPPF